jgi:hypothetical protein
VATGTLDILATLFSLAKLTESQRAAYAEVSGADAQALVRYAYRECKSSPAGATALFELAQRVEVSDVPLSQWISQIISVYRWMEVRDVQAPFREIVDYVSCACEGSGLQAGHSVEWYLEQYGFEGARKG